jgi:hypothetical protein
LEFPQGISESHPPNDKPGKTIIIEGSKYQNTQPKTLTLLKYKQNAKTSQQTN